MSTAERIIDIEGKIRDKAQELETNEAELTTAMNDINTTEEALRQNRKAEEEANTDLKMQQELQKNAEIQQKIKANGIAYSMNIAEFYNGLGNGITNVDDNLDVLELAMKHYNSKIRIYTLEGDELDITFKDALSRLAQETDVV